MRRKDLAKFVAEQMHSQFYDDVARAVTECEAFDALCGTLQRECDGDPYAIEEELRRIADELSDEVADWLVGDTPTGEGANTPAAYIAAKVDGDMQNGTR